MFFNRISNFLRMSHSEKRAVLASVFASSAIVAFSISPIVVESFRTSDSYKVVGDLVASLGGEKTSNSYKMLGSMKDKAMGIMAGDSYTISGGTSYPISADAVSITLTSMTPNTGYNSGVIDAVRIRGSSFKTGASVKLVMAGEDDIVASMVKVNDATDITCSIDLTGRKTGLWDLVVTNTDSSMATLASAFNMKTWATQGLIVNYPNPFSPSAGPTTVIYQLSADTDTTLLIFNVTAELVYKRDFIAGAEGGRKGDNAIEWNGYNAFGEMSGNGVYFARLIERGTGKLIAKGKIAVSR